jgi:hypothetical protein
LGWNDFSLPACGERFDNEDGTSRQEELARCKPGEPVRLVREPDNRHDPMAVAVYSCRGIRVGYLKRDRAVWIGSKIDRGYDVRAIVERVKGAGLPDAPLGLVMRVSMDRRQADPPELRAGRCPTASALRERLAQAALSLRPLAPPGGQP